MGYIQKIFRPINKKDKSLAIELKKILDFKPRQLQYYKRALTHKSMSLKDKNKNPFNYERLEYVGDAILGAVIAKYLFVSVPGANEGYLTKMRSKIVRRDQLNKIGKDLRLIRLMRAKEDLSKFSDNTNGNLLESLIGAICLDMGYLACEKFIYSKIINPYVDISSLEGRIMSYKSLIVEWCQKNKKSFKFNCVEEQSKENLKHFSATLQIDSKTVSKARSTSRKKAEEKACKRAFFALQNKIHPVIK